MTWTMPQDSNGATRLDPSAQQVYIDKTNAGNLTSALGKVDPKKAITVNIAAGTTLSHLPIPFSGAAPDAPLAFVKYGAGPDPLIRPYKTQGAYPFQKQNIAFIGLHFKPVGRDPSEPNFDKAGAQTPLTIIRCQRILIEGCTVEFGHFGIDCEAGDAPQETKRGSDLIVRRSTIRNNYGINNNMCSGLYAANVDNILLEENIFYHNGWLDKKYGEIPTIFNHNCYLQWNCSGVIVRGNLFAEASSHGIQVRPGGQVYQNIFYKNPLHLSFGAVNGGDQSKQTLNYATGDISRNVFIGSRDINGQPRGTAIDTTNTHDLVITQNLIYNDMGQRNGGAINFSINAKHVGHGIKNMTVRENVIRLWSNPFTHDPGYHKDGNADALQVTGLIADRNDCDSPIETKLWQSLIQGTAKTRAMPTLSDAQVQAIAQTGWTKDLDIAGMALSILARAEILDSSPIVLPPPVVIPAMTYDIKFRSLDSNGAVVNGDLSNGAEIPAGTKLSIISVPECDSLRLTVNGVSAMDFVSTPGDYNILVVGVVQNKEVVHETLILRVSAVPPIATPPIITPPVKIDPNLKHELVVRVSSMSAQLTAVDSSVNPTNKIAKSGIKNIRTQVDACKKLLGE